jgi:hypothetical protein
MAIRSLTRNDPGSPPVATTYAIRMISLFRVQPLRYANLWNWTQRPWEALGNINPSATFGCE